MSHLRPVTAPMLLLQTGGLDGFREIPDNFVVSHRGDKARVLCPCGFRPVLERGELRSCRANATSPHRCDRMFLNLGSRVMVAGGPRG